MGTSSKKIRIGVLYGGRSGEHEISLQSAASVIRNLNPDRYEVVPIGVDKEGRWHVGDIKLLKVNAKTLPLFKDAPEVVLPSHSDNQGALIPLAGGAKGGGPKLDVVFTVMHGPMCEDGTIQGMLELAEMPYVGSGVLGSAIGMDKEVAKRLAKEAGIPIVPFVSVKKQNWASNSKKYQKKIVDELGLPVFVKPANMGSSVGVHKVKTAADLVAAMDDAFRYDTKVLAERAVNAREIELSVLEDPDHPDEPKVSVPGEIVPTHEFYSYDAKYIDENGANLVIPAKLTPAQTKEAQDLAKRIFVALECEGMARVDMFLEKDTGKFFLNEVNTIPGFTQISMFPKLWEATGISYTQLLDKLVELAMIRHRRKQALSKEYLPEE